MSLHSCQLLTNVFEGCKLCVGFKQLTFKFNRNLLVLLQGLLELVNLLFKSRSQLLQRKIQSLDFCIFLFPEILKFLLKLVEKGFVLIIQTLDLVNEVFLPFLGFSQHTFHALKMTLLLGCDSFMLFLELSDEVVLLVFEE